MNTSLNHGSAKIYQFPVGGRSALVFTSPLQRARHTAHLAMPHNEATVVDALAEYDYGNYEGLTSDQITAERPGWNDLASSIAPTSRSGRRSSW